MYKFDNSINDDLKFSPFVSLLLLLVFVVIGLLLGSLCAYVFVALPSAGFDLARAEYIISNLKASCQDVTMCHALQGVSMFLPFVVMPMIYLQYVEQRSFSDFFREDVQLQKQLHLFPIGLVFLLSVYPFALQLRELTLLAVEHDVLGTWGKDVIAGELAQTELIEALLNVNYPTEYISLFLVIALLPAFGEELVFRGFLQNILLKVKLNHHLAIWITGILFSAFHFNLTDFFPRMLLGAILGYSYYYSKNFWIPVFLHFMNNALSVIYYLALDRSIIDYDMEAPDQVSGVAVLVGIALTGVFWFLFRKKANGSLY